MTYLLDANVFIEAKRRLYYGFELCPGYWQWLVDANAAGIVYSIERVADEISIGNDELVDWVRDRGDAFFLGPDDNVLTSLRLISTWATSDDYTQAAVTKFLGDADSYLVAHAHAYGHIVVTLETTANSPGNVKIPDACTAVGVDCIDHFEMLRREGVRFVLDTSS